MPRTERPSKMRARRAQATQEVVNALQSLRLQIETMSEQYRMRVAGQLADLERSLHGDESLGLPKRFVTLRASEAVLRCIGDVEMKPKKGRAKDFVRMEELVAALTELVPPER